MAANPYRRGTKRFAIAELLQAGMSARDTFHALKPSVLDQVRPFVFQANIGGMRSPKPISEQVDELRYEVNRVSKKLGRTDEVTEEEARDDSVIPAPIPEPEEDEDEDDSDDYKSEAWIRREKDFFLREIRRIRRWISDRQASMGEAVDHISMRPVVAAKKAIPVGIPARALLAAMAMHWNEDSKRAAGIPDFDFEALSLQVLTERKLNGLGFHRLLGYVLLLAEARVPIQLVGPAGGGKSTLMEQLAEVIFSDSSRYAYVPMTAGATPSWLIGSWTIEGFRTRPFLEMYSGGGVFNFEELDASDPNMLLVANNALASDTFHNPINGQAYEKHADFIPCSTSNTYGLGANRQYSARERLDLATIDRWRMGRVFVPIDEDLEREILG